MDKQRVISLAKQKSLAKKEDKAEKAERAEKEKAEKGGDKTGWVLVEEPLISQRLMMNEVFTVEAQQLYEYLYHRAGPSGITRQKETYRGEWELRDGFKVREVNFTDTIKVPSKDKERYVLAKFKDLQQIFSEEKGHFVVSSEITCTDPEVHEGVAIHLTTTISAEAKGKCWLSVSCQLKFPKALVQRELVDDLFDTLEVICREITDSVNGNLVTPSEKQTLAAGIQSRLSSGQKPQAANSAHVIYLLVIGAAVAVVICLLLMWYLSSPPTPTLTEDEIKWLSFIKKTTSGHIDHNDSVANLFSQYKSKVIGNAKVDMEQNLAAIYERFQRLKAHEML